VISEAVRTDLIHAAPADVRAAIRRGDWRSHTAGLAAGYVQANLVVLPREDAYDFLLFSVRNPKPCPLVDVADTGSPVPALAAPKADLRVDLPRYRVYQHGELAAEPESIAEWWRDDLVAFLIGCSYTFEHALVAEGIPLRHLQRGTNVPMYRTNIDCRPAGAFHGPLVVSMRPIRDDLIERTVEISGRYPRAHGTPVHIGDPAAIGIGDLAAPDWGDPVAIEPGETPVFWACGVTPQAVAMSAKPALMITHAPGHMFITDIPLGELAG
jgi:uncharacterized protein YcsI (UPF0317 family)